MTNPYQNTATARLIADRICDLAQTKTQAESASETGFPNANMMPFFKNDRNRVPLGRVPSLAKALEVDLAYLMRLALDQTVGATAAKAITDIFGTPATQTERGWLQSCATRRSPATRVSRLGHGQRCGASSANERGR